MQVIQINTATGTPPYDIYVCDETLTYCYLVSTGVSVLPVFIDLPQVLSGINRVIVKLIDSIGCELFLDVGCLLPTPSITVTPSYTPTPTPTQTKYLYPCQCITFDNSGGGEDIGYSYRNCYGIVIADTILDGDILPVCGSEPIAYNIKLTYTVNGNCVGYSCP